MVSVEHMRNADNDNADTWISLSAATERALERHEKQKENRDPENSGDRANHENDPDQRDRIAEGVRNIERFERRYRTRR